VPTGREAKGSLHCESYVMADIDKLLSQQDEFVHQDDYVAILGDDDAGEGANPEDGGTVPVPADVPDANIIEVDELLVRHTNLDLEIDKFLEIETWNDIQFEDVSDEAEVEVPEQDEETKAVFAQDPNDIKRALKERGTKIEVMTERIAAMGEEMVQSSRSNIEAMKIALETQERAELNFLQDEADVQTKIENEQQQRSSAVDDIKAQNDLLRKCFASKTTYTKLPAGLFDKLD